METRDGQTYLAIHFEAARGSQEAEGRWFEGVGGWEDDAAVVDPVCEGGGCWGAADGEMPFEEV